MKTTTLAEIREFGPCAEGWRTLTTELGDDYGAGTPLALARIVETNGIADALWAVRTQSHADIVDLACRYAESVAALNPDPRVQAAIDAARGVIAGTHTRQDAAYAADAADAARAAAYAAYAAYAANAADAARAAYRTKIFLEWCAS
jgi:hypothetical protein